MQTKNLIFLSGVVAAAVIEERDLMQCQSVAKDMLPQLAGVPTPDSTLLDFIAKQTQWATITDNCKIPAVTGAIGDDYTSWMKEVTSWYKSNSEGLGKLLAACSDVPEVASIIDSVPAAATVCSELSWDDPAKSGDKSTQAAATGTPAASKSSGHSETKTGSGSGATTPAPTSAAPASGTSTVPGNSAVGRQAGVVGALAVAAVAAVAML